MIAKSYVISKSFDTNFQLHVYPCMITGFIGGTRTACCGGGGPYNYNASAECGQGPLIRACDDPSQYVSWDGIHLTEAAYRLIANAILEETYMHYHSSS